MSSELVFKVFGEGADLYEVLGIARTATDEEIRRAYRKKALKFHPDKCPGDEHAAERFQALSMVHSILSDATKRQLYDNTGDIDSSDMSSTEQEWSVSCILCLERRCERLVECVLWILYMHVYIV